MHRIDVKYSKHLDETVYHKKLDSGLDVYVIPKKNFLKSYAFFATEYGGMFNQFKLDDSKLIDMPMGVAHFLEHQIFEDQDESTFLKFEKIGANVNAYTSNNSTVYYFDTVNDFDLALEYLMELVQHTSITSKTVEKEKGIIVQEINMYKDDIDWQVMMAINNALYHNHPIIYDIAGTVASVNSITTEEVLSCYDYFYNPHNMSVFVYGDVNPVEIIDKVDSLQTEAFQQKHYSPTAVMPFEPLEVKSKEVIIASEIAKDRFILGIKLDGAIAKEEHNRYLAGIKIALDLMFGRSSAFYERSFESGLITDGLGFDIQIGDNYANIMISGETNDVDSVKMALLQELDVRKELGFEISDFNRIKKKILGRMLMSLNSVQALSNNYTHHKMSGYDLFDYVEKIQEMAYEEMMTIFTSICDTKNHSIVILRQK